MTVPALSAELTTPGRGHAGKGTANDLPIAPPAPPTFQCPGEAHPIGAAVHYQRLANGYARCHDCVHRSEHGLLPLPPQRLLRSPRTVADLFLPEGIRGIVPNELTDRVACDFGRAIGQTLWHGMDAGETGPDDLPRPIRRRPPVLVVGIDGRPSSPRLAGSLVRGLRESAVEILDAGRITEPMLRWGTDHWRADAGLFVTGAGHAASFGGFQLIAPAGRTWCAGGPLDRLREAMSHAAGRPRRTGGDYRTIDAEAGYLAALQGETHGLRPVHVGIATADPVLRAACEEVLAPSPIEVSPLPLHETETEMRRGPWDLGVTFSEEGSRGDFRDECGALIPPENLIRQLGRQLLGEWSHVSIAVATDRLPTLERDATADEFLLFHDGGPTSATLVAAMDSVGAQLGLDAAGRIWLTDGETGPRCDGLLVLLRILALLSRRAEPTSWLRRPTARTEPDRVSDRPARIADVARTEPGSAAGPWRPV